MQSKHFHDNGLVSQSHNRTAYMLTDSRKNGSHCVLNWGNFRPKNYTWLKLSLSI